MQGTCPQSPRHLHHRPQVAVCSPHVRSPLQPQQRPPSAGVENAAPAAGAGGHGGVKPQWLAVKRDPATLALQYQDQAGGGTKILSIELTGLQQESADQLTDTIFAQCAQYFGGVPRRQVVRLIRSLQL